MNALDRELPQLLARDLPRYFPRVVEGFQQRLYGFALRLMANPQDAEDITQEAFISAYVTLENYPPARIAALQLQAWLYKITLHVYQHHARSARLHLVPLDLGNDAAYDIMDAEAEQPAAWTEHHEMQAELAALVAQLPPRYRLAVTCYYLEQMSYHEVAQLLDQPLGTVKSTIHRGLAQLRALMAAQSATRKEQDS